MLALLLRHVVAFSLLALMCGQAGASVLVLDDTRTLIDAWPHITVLSDPGGTMGFAEVYARKREFVEPVTPRANLGVRHGAVWLRLPIVVTAEPVAKDWMVSLDYASLDRVDLYVLEGTALLRHVEMGRSIPFSRRPWPSSVHAAKVSLQPGHAYEVLLRVETLSSMIVPLSVATPSRFEARESANQAAQGLMAGVALCLLAYSLIQWVGLRDAMFLHYSLALAGICAFFVSYSGLGPQHLWGDDAWLTSHLAPLSVLLAALPGAFLFVDRAIKADEVSLAASRAMKTGAILTTLAGLAFAAGLASYRSAQTIATLLGPMPMLLAIPVAWARVRRGERVGYYMLAGWGVYAIGTVTMAGLLRGFLPSNFWTQHAFQFASLFEMLVWMRVLGLRIEEIQASAQRAHIERDALRSLAHADPLTGLPNRRGLNEALGRVLAGRAQNHLVAVYLIDLDGFKPINDRFGHDAGDEVLIGTAQRLQGMLRTSDVVARLGGDEFVVIAPGLRGDEEARAVGTKLIDAFDQPFEVQGQLCRVGLTIGYAIAPLDGHEAIDLLKRADAAMYAGKQDGRHCVRRGVASVGLVAA